MRITYLSLLCLCLSFSLLLPVSALAWAPSGGDPGGGFTWNTATAGTVKLYYNGAATGFQVSSAGVVGAVTGNFSTALNSAAYRNAAGTGPAPLTYGAHLPGSAAPTAPTTGVVLYADLTSGDPAVSVLGASGKSPGICVPKLAVGPVGSALPAYAGCVKWYPNLNDGATVYPIDLSGYTGTVGGSADSWVYVNSTNYWSAYSSVGFVCQGVRSGGYSNAAGTGPAQLTYGAHLPGSAATTAPTTGVNIWASLTSGSPTLTLQGASGKTPAVYIPGGVKGGYFCSLSGAAMEATFGVLLKPMAAPTAPALGDVIVYADSTSKVLEGQTSASNGVYTTAP